MMSDENRSPRPAPVPCVMPIFDRWEPSRGGRTLLVLSAPGLVCRLRLQS